MKCSSLREEIAISIEAILIKILKNRWRAVDILPNIWALKKIIQLLKGFSSTQVQYRALVHFQWRCFRLQAVWIHITMSLNQLYLIWFSCSFYRPALKHVLKAMNTQTRDWQTKGSVGCKWSSVECFWGHNTQQQKRDIFRANWREVSGKKFVGGVDTWIMDVTPA